MKRAFWLAFACVTVLALVLTSCGKPATQTTSPGTTVSGTTTPSTGTTPSTTAVTAKTTTAGGNLVPNAVGKMAEKPQYGGTVTFYMASSSMSNIDPVRSALSGWMSAMTYETPVIADWSKGPEGTGENPFTASYQADQFLTGAIAESWQYKDLQTLVFQVRRGVRFQNVAPVNGRELTVADILATFNRYINNPLSSWGRPSTVKPEDYSTFTQTGPWEVTYHAYIPSIGLLQGLYWFNVQAAEMVTKYNASANLLEASCGTGPYRLSDMAIGSSATWKKNEIYWMKDPLWPGNTLPYIDTLRGIDIPDYSTQLAALRVHKLDIMGVDWQKAEELKKTNPELLFKKQSPTGSNVVFMRTDIAPYNDKRVRQALTLAVDKKGMLDNLLQGNGFLNTWPVQPSHSAFYTAIEDLPANIKALWGYDPVAAKKLLVDAGFPSGFKQKLHVYAGSETAGAILKEAFDAIGVLTDIVVHEGTEGASVLYGRKYDGMFYTYWGNASPTSAIGSANGGTPTSIYNFSNVVDDVAAQMIKAYNLNTDPVARAKMAKEEAVRQMELCWEVPVPAASGYTFWVPYLKGYSGEIGLGPTAEMGTTGIYRFMWVDKDLKFKITGQSSK